MYLVKFLLRLELYPIKVLDDVGILDLERFDAGRCFFKVNMFLITRLAHLSISIIVKSFFLGSLVSIFAAFLEQILAVLNN